jgi:hypothetical protein
VISDSADLEDQQLPSGVSKGVLTISHREPFLHTSQQQGVLRISGVSSRKPIKLKAKRLVGSSDLGDCYGNGTLRGTNVPWLIAVPRSPLALSFFFVATSATKQVGLLGFEQWLRDKPDGQLQEARDDFGLWLGAAR